MKWQPIENNQEAKAVDEHNALASPVTPQRLLWKKEHTDQSTIEIRLATRINISTLDCE